MGKYVVHYFDSRGRAEIIRLTLTAAGLPFEDHRFTREQWPEEKKKSPVGQAPWIETPDGEKMNESLAIARYIAMQHGLYGKNPKDNYHMERAIGCINDISNEMMKIYFATDAEKEQKKKEFVEGRAKTLVQHLLGYIKELKGMFLVGDYVTLADLCLINIVDHLRNFAKPLIEEFPQLQEHYDNVCKTVPAIGDWVKERPKTAM